MEIHTPAPTLIRDKIIYGEVVSLIPVNTSWCRGYMMVQVDMENLHSVLRQSGKNPDYDKEPEVSIPPMIGELTNLMWGRIQKCLYKRRIL